MAPISAASINFGGINGSKLEFVDFSTPESKQFFETLQKDWESLGGCSQKFREWIVQHLFVNSIPFGDASQIKIPERFNQMIRDASEFMERNLEPEFLKELFPGVVSGASIVAGYCHTDATFDLNDVGMGTFMNLVLKKDKGIGGLEQIFQNRPTNIGNLNQFLDKGDDGVYRLRLIPYLDQVKDFYLTGSGLPEDGFKRIKAYKDVFLKGRKEGPDGSTRNYYYEVDDPMNDKNMAQFQSLANLVMMIYDVISVSLINQQGGVVPSNIPEKPSASVVATQKTNFIAHLILKNGYDVVFLTECVPEVFSGDDNDVFEGSGHLLEREGYHIHYGPETGGLCNAIIYQNIPEFANLEEVAVEEDVYTRQDEFKEIPLHLRNQTGDLHLIAYHANGKGVDQDRNLNETSFVSWFNSLEGQAIMGCDLNMDFKKKGDILSEHFEMGSPHKKGSSCYKQRTPIQAQYDKAGVFDTKYCDYIITKGFEREGVRVVRATHQGEIDLRAEHFHHVQNKQELVIPNNSFPFEHYIVTDTVGIEETEETTDNGFKFFGGISESLTWIDGLLNWLTGY